MVGGEGEQPNARRADGELTGRGYDEDAAGREGWAGLYLASIVGMSVVGGIAAEQYPMAHPTLRLITGDHWPADVVLMVLCASTLYFPYRQMMRAYQKGYYRART